MAQLFAARPANDLPQVPNLDVRPTDRVHTITAQAGARRLGAMRWGFVPHWQEALNSGPPLINARAETIAQKPAFAAACRHCRCLIPASAFYEWTTHEGRKQPWRIAAPDGAPLALAGIWQDWTDPAQGVIQTCAIVTTAANKALAALHHRMPVIVPPPAWPLWLGEAGHGAARLMASAPEDALIYETVARF